MIDLLEDEPTTTTPEAEATFRSSRADPVLSTGPLDASGLDTFRAPDLDPGDGPAALLDVDQDGEAIAPDAPPVQIDQDQFWEVWQLCWGLPGAWVEDFKPLASRPGERPASDAVHRLLEIYYPRALQPGSETVGLLLTAAPVLWFKVQMVREILAARRTARIEAARRSFRTVQGGRADPPPPDTGAEGPGLAGVDWFEGGGDAAS